MTGNNTTYQGAQRSSFLLEQIANEADDACHGFAVSLMEFWGEMFGFELLQLACHPPLWR
jgi:hypothetical protein